MRLQHRAGVALLPLFVPFAACWVRVREREALAHGVALDARQMADAHAARVLFPDRVRLLRVAEIPTFTHPLLAPLAWLARPLFARTAGITLGYGIPIRTEFWGSRRLVVHELAHVAQYERLSGIAPFLRVYLRECLLEGYPNGTLEQEAAAVAGRVCGFSYGS